jgi:hypothetical protein
MRWTLPPGIAFIVTLPDTALAEAYRCPCKCSESVVIVSRFLSSRACLMSSRGWVGATRFVGCRWWVVGRKPPVSDLPDCAARVNPGAIDARTLSHLSGARVLPEASLGARELHDCAIASDADYDALGG